MNARKSKWLDGKNDGQMDGWMGKWMSGCCRGKWSKFLTNIYSWNHSSCHDFQWQVNQQCLSWRLRNRKSGRMERGRKKASSLSQPLCQVIASFPVLPTVFLCGYHNIYFIGRETEWD